jgi:hypothetical protein
VKDKKAREEAREEEAGEGGGKGGGGFPLSEKVIPRTFVPYYYKDY